MADYYWSPQGMADPLVLPGEAVERCLTLAGREQLQVLLWLSRQRLRWDAAACSKALSLPTDVCEGCRRFWEEQGVLVPIDAKGAVKPAAVAAAVPTARPAAVKPQLKEVLHYQQQHPEFAGLVEAASARLGKAIGHGDTATLLYLLDTVGLPIEVILTEIAYAVAIGKPNMRYVEKIALDWADREMTTLQAVDDHIHYLERCRQAAARVETVLALPKPLTAAQGQLAEKWLEQWHVSEAMLQHAAAMTEEKTGKFTPAYMDKILDRWHCEGIDTPEKLAATLMSTGNKRKGAVATNPEESSLDVADFEADLMRYTPVFGQH